MIDEICKTERLKGSNLKNEDEIIAVLILHHEDTLQLVLVFIRTRPPE
jgi:hypothetical protein